MLRIIKIALLSIICVALVGFMITLIQNGFNFKNIKPKLIYDESFEVGTNEKIAIDVKSSDVTIYESEDDKIKVEIYGNDKEDVDVENSLDTLSIKIKNKTKVCFGICYGSNIKLYVPKTYTGSFDIKATSGDVISKIKTYNKYVINVTSGDIEIKNAASLSGHATSGDVEIDKLNNYISFKTTSGDIEIDSFEVNKDSSIKVTSGDIDIDECTNAYVDASAKSGDIKVKGNDRHAQYELKITATSGDITVN